MSRVFLLSVLIITSGESTQAGSLPSRSSDDRRDTPNAMAHDSAVNGLVFSPDARTLYTAGDDGTLRSWDVATGRELMRIAAHKQRIIALAISGDGTRLATGGQDSFARLWDAHSGKQLREISVDAGCADGVSLSHDGRWLIVSHSGITRRFRAFGDAPKYFT